MSVTVSRFPQASAVDRQATDRLLRRWAEHRDPRDRDRLVAEFMPLARRLALRYIRAHEPLDDLVQVAAIGLIKSLDRFDPDRGVAFSSFAIPTVLGELKRHFRDHCWSIHVPRSEQELTLRTQQAVEELTARTGRTPTVRELADWLSLDMETVATALDVAANTFPVSLDTPLAAVDDGGSAVLGDTVGAVDGRYEDTVVRASLASATAMLDPADQRLLALRFDQELTQREIAGQLGCSQMHVSRLLRRALRRLRAEYEAGDPLVG